MLRMLDSTYDGNDQRDLNMELVFDCEGTEYHAALGYNEHLIFYLKTNGISFDYAHNRVVFELE